MKIHLPTPYSPVILAPPPKPMTADWMTELAAQVELTKVAQRRAASKRWNNLLTEDDQPEAEPRDPNASSGRRKLDFLA